MRRLLPDPGPTTLEQQLASYRPGEQAPAERPFVAMNFAATVDGRATIEGVSGPIGSQADTAMLSGLRGRFDALMIGAGTKRAERYEGLAQRLVVVESGGGAWADLLESRLRAVFILLCTALIFFQAMLSLAALNAFVSG